MPSSSFLSFFVLPFDIQDYVLQFCGPAALAKVARVSRAFLELSSSLLYKDVHISGYDQLRLLFCKRKAPRFFRLTQRLERLKRKLSRKPRPPPFLVAPFLSLSQLQTLTVTLDSEEVFTTVSKSLELPLSLSRTSPNSPLSLETFTLVQPHPIHPTFEDWICPPTLFEVVNPKHFVAQGHNVYQPPFPVVLTDSWDRLKTIKLVSYWPFSLVQLVGQIGRHLSFIFDLTQIKRSRFEGDLGMSFIDFPFPPGMDVVAVVATEERREMVWALLQSKMDRVKLSAEERTRALAQVKVQVDDRVSLIDDDYDEDEEESL